MGEVEKQLRAELKTLESGPDAAAVEAARRRLDDAKTALDAQFDREGPGPVKSDYYTGLLLPAVEKAQQAFNAIAGPHRDALARIAELRQMLDAKPLAEQAERRLSQLRKTEAAARADIEPTVQDHAKLAALADAERTAAQAARARVAAEAVASLDLGHLAQYAVHRPGLPTHEGELQSPEAHEARARSLDETAERAQAKVDRLRVSVAEIQRDIAATIQQVLEHRAHAAALEHAEAFAVYLPVLRKHRAAYQAAFGYTPEAPRMVEAADDPVRDDGERDDSGSTDGLARQMRAALEQAEAPAPAKGLKKIAAAMGF